MIQVPDSRLPLPGARTLVREQGLSIVVLNVDGHLYAMDDDCPHRAGSLFSGKLDGMLLQCPAHGLKFDIGTGCMRGGELRARCYSVTRADGHALIRLIEIPH